MKMKREKRNAENTPGSSYTTEKETKQTQADKNDSS